MIVVVALSATATATATATVTTTVRPEAAGAERGGQHGDREQHSNAFNHNNISLICVSVIINSGMASGMSAIR